MKTKEEIVTNWLPRYTGTPLKDFGKYILLANFDEYLNMFSEWYNVPICGREKPMPNVTAEGITIINFGMGSANAATIMDLLRAIQPDAALFLGKCGGLKKKNDIGDLVLPIAALPAFNLQKAISTTIRNHNRDYWTGTVYTTNRRVWEHDEQFKEYLRRIRAMAVDMETATLFSTGFYNEIPTGALLLISDQPMTPEGIKTAESDKKVTQEYLDMHLKIGVDALKELINNGLTVKHLYF